MNKKPTTPFLFKILAFMMRLLEKISPVLSGRLALYLFLHPLRYKRPSRELKCYNAAKKSFIIVEGKKVATYEWGEGPAVWIMHGWSGRATQLSPFIKKLVDSGHKVIGIDAPGHGDSEGNNSSVFLFESALSELYQKYGKAHAYIGHSLGGAVGFYAMKNSIPYDKYISISAPSIADLILHEAFDKFGTKQKSIDAMRQLIFDRVGAPFENYTAGYWAQFAPNIPILIIHDEDDKEAHIEHAYALQSILPNAIVHYTKGLGHARILRDEKIIEKVVGFIQE